jgi:CRP/FNR family transcriptional regulator, cyclic AMP receptor protein
MKNKKDTSAYQVWGAEKIIYGPIDLLTLVDWVRQKRVTPECWIYCERRGTWSQAANLEDLKLLFDPSQGRPGHLVGAIKAGVNPDVMLRIRVLSGMNDNQLQAFIRYMEILTLDSMTVAVREGDRGDAMFLILEGELRVRVMRHGKESILATLKAGDFFGEISLLDEGPRSADVVANDRSTLLKISTASFAKLRKEAPSLAEPFLHSLGQILVGRMRVLNKRYVDSLLMLQSLAAPRGMGSRNSNPRAGARP